MLVVLELAFTLTGVKHYTTECIVKTLRIVHQNHCILPYIKEGIKFTVLKKDI